MSRTCRFRTLAILLAALCPELARADEYAVVVHAGNHLTNISQDTLRRVFLGEKQRWSGPGRRKIHLVLPRSRTPEHTFLLQHVWDMSERELAKHWVEMIYRNRIAKRPKQLPSKAVILSVVQRIEGAIAVVNAKGIQNKHKLKILAVDGLMPGQEGYPLTTPEKSANLATAVGVMTAGSQDDDLQERLEALESELAQVSIELATGGSVAEDFHSGPRLDLGGFGHVEIGVTDSNSETTNEIALGGLDLFITSQLDENLSFLNETVFEPTAQGDYVLDVERVILKYQVSDRLNFQAGRFHTTIGVWNEMYHHGEWLHTSIGRPAVLNFEDENGVLPVHLIGLVMKGRQDLGGTRIDYTLEVGNGRGPTPDPPQITIDANDPKAINLTLGVSPRTGLRFGGGVYSDRIPEKTGVDAHAELDELIFSAFLSYEAAGWEVLAEWVNIDHEGGVGGSAGSEGYYFQLGRKLENWTPYARFDGLSLDNKDTFFVNRDNRETLALGMRWDFSQWAALKLQYEHTNIDSVSGINEDEDRLAFQLAFAF